MSILTIFLGIIIFIIVLTFFIYLYNNYLSGAVIYDLKKDITSNIIVDKPTSSNYYFSLWIYVNSFSSSNIKNGKPIFYYGKWNNYSENINRGIEGTLSSKIVYLQLNQSTPTLEYYYSTNDNSTFNYIPIKQIPIQKWTHVIISTTGNILEFYIDGKLIKTIHTSAPLIDINKEDNIKIGKTLYSPTGNIMNYPHDTFVSKIQRMPNTVNAKTAYDLYLQGPGTGLNVGNSSKYDLLLQLSQNNNVIKSFSTK